MTAFIMSLSVNDTFFLCDAHDSTFERRGAVIVKYAHPIRVVTCIPSLDRAKRGLNGHRQKSNEFGS
jgi:hypothetical protein